MLKISRGKLVFIVPRYWLNAYGLLKPKAIGALAVFFGDMTNEEADKDVKKRENRVQLGLISKRKT